MASYTPNLNLYKPDSTDDFGDFRAEFNNNMDILDGGGGGDSVSYTQTLATGEKVGEITINGTPTFDAYNREYLSNGKRHYAGDYVYDETLDVVNPMNMPPLAFVSTGDIYKDNASLISYMSSYNRLYGYALRNNDYLATINNLSSVVTKDSTQTMKVIYTLTFTA